jgi:hypothetical protein
MILVNGCYFFICAIHFFWLDAVVVVKVVSLEPVELGFRVRL